MTDQQELVAQTFERVLENLAFMFTEVAEEAPPPPQGPLVVARMTFSGPQHGRLELMVPHAMCPDIAANVLGLDPGDELVQAKPYDAVKELLNVTCGQLLTAVLGEEPVFNLSIPEVDNADEDPWRAAAAREGTVAVFVDDEPVLLFFEVQDNG